MIAGLTPKSIVLCFFSVLILYAAVFSGVQYWREKDGPWQVTFITSATGEPSIEITHEKLNVANLNLLFPGQTVTSSNLNATVVFDRPQQPLPFGKRLHEDLVSFPGVETLELFGHQIELFPRSLRIDGTEHSWKSNTTLTITPSPPH